jgi:adhesin transport system outer membrane protein
LRFLKVLPFIFLSVQAQERVTFDQGINTSCNIEFEKIILDGLQSHPSIQMSKETIKGAQFEVDSAKWEYYPTPSIDYSVKSSDKKRVVARLDQPIWTGGKLDSAHDKAKAMEQQARHELDENRYKLIDSYVEALKEYLKTEKKIKALNHNKKKFYDLSLMLDRFMQAGELSQTDKNLLNSRIASISSDLIITKSKHKVALIQLEILTGKKIGCQIRFSPNINMPTQIDVDGLVRDFQAYHPTLKMMDAKILAAIAEVDSAKSKLWPSLVLRGEHVRGTIYEETEPETENLIYLSINVAPGAGLSGLSNVDKAKVAIAKTKHEKSTKEKELLDELMADYTNYITAINHIQMIQDDIKTAELIYESNQRLFTSGKKRWLDLVNSLSELSKQKVKYTELLVDKTILEYKIALKTGRVNLDTLEVVSGI